MTGFPTVYEAQDALLVAISTLHNRGKRFHADLTYGKGGFWKGEAERVKPRIRTDLHSADADLTHPSVDVTKLSTAHGGPFEPGSLRSVVFDPPFIHAAGKDSIMGQRFGSYPSQNALRQMYWKAMMEFQVVLVDGGLLVWKGQDIIESGKQNWNHLEIMMNARTCGMPCIDLAILVRKHTIQGHNHTNQQHFRKNHSYFMIFRKGGDKR
jgi:hypothetical protein